MKKKEKIICYLVMFITILMIFITKWIFKTYGDVSFDQILFFVTMPNLNVDKNLIYSFIFDYLFVVLIEYCLGIFIIKKVVKIINKNKIKYLKYFLIFIMFSIGLICTYRLGMIEYIIYGNIESTFIEDNYINPSDVKLKFPNKKRNLIYLYIESFESSFYSKELGGYQDDNLLEEMYLLSQSNISFSDTNKLGGAMQLYGTNWTTASLMAQTSGLPLKLPYILVNDSDVDHYLNNINSLGQILEKEGYNQKFMLGSDSNFGNQKQYFENNGNYKVYDYYDAINDGKIDEDYYVWWGYEDSKLFSYAKEELINLSNQDAPFNLTLITINTHTVGGYLEKECESKYDSQYANVIACTSKQISEFVNWCQQQEFYENTSIIIVGDHLSMDPYCFSFKNENRRIFNLFINSSLYTDNIYNRKFSTLDMFPTTLASLGVIIEGDRLGLGVNLFSDTKTLIEEYGFKKVNRELGKKSTFYNEKILNFNDLN